MQDIKGREDAIEYAKKFNIPVPVTKKSIYSRDRNLWHISHEVGPTNNPQKQSPWKMLKAVLPIGCKAINWFL